MPVTAVIAEDYLWEKGLSDCPGPLLPEAKGRIDRLIAESDRVVVCTPCAATMEGAKRAKALLEIDLGLGLGAKLDLHVGFGIPEFDRLVHADCEGAK